MCSLPHRKPVALLGLLLLLFGGQAVAQAFSWCIGEDGHAVLKSAAGDTCGITLCRDGEAHPGDHFEADSPDEQCGPCADFSSSLEAASGRSREPSSFQFALALPVTPEVPLAPVIAGVFGAGFSPRPPPGPSQALLGLRTVVLLN